MALPGSHERERAGLFNGAAAPAADATLTADGAVTLSADAGSLAASGDTVSLRSAVPVTAGSLAASGDTVTPRVTLAVDPGELTASGGTLVVSYDRTVTATAGELTASGDGVGLGGNKVSTATAGILTAGGGTVAFRSSLPAAAGTLTASGAPVIIVRGLSAQGVPSEEAIGEPLLYFPPQYIFAGPIGTQEAVGAPLISTGPATIHALGLPSQAGVGRPHLVDTAPFADGDTSTPISATPRRANRLYDPLTDEVYEWEVNHTTEDPQAFARGYDVQVGTIAQQTANTNRLRFTGTILSFDQKATLDHFWELGRDSVLVYEDWSGDTCEVILTGWDPRPVRGRNPVEHKLYYWTYTIEMEVVAFVSGAYARAY